ncbi:MAG TPA: DUF4383 domain-containing protein [Longimicrobium sp.]|nr:DUF4383 domain-containing protein [Longimicrobium sp.]
MQTMTQKAAMVFGVVFLLVGLLGLFLPGGMGMDANMDSAPRLLGLFPVNLLHNLVHLAFGAWGLAASRSYSASRGYHRAGAVIYLVLVVLAFVDPTTFGLVPIGGNDIWLHALLAAGLGYFGFLHREAAVPAS